MSDYNIAFNHTQKYEGGYQASATDPGNYNAFNELVGTNHGITPNVYQPYLYFVPDEQAMRDMTKEQAYNIALIEFWNKYNLGSIQCQDMANNLFDVIFHFSNYTEGFLIQQSMYDIGQTLPGYGMDGIIGSETITKLQEICSLNKSNEFIEALKNRRIQFYDDVVRNKPEMQEYYNGWINRANYFGKTNSTSSFTAGSGMIIPLLVLGTLFYNNKK